MTCSGSYVTTGPDVTAGSVTNTATATGTPAQGSLAPVTAQATITFVGAPAWTLTKTPSPTTYTAAGQTIDYSYLLSNTGNTTISAISVTDDKVSSIVCPAATLAAGDDMTCTGSYVTTAGDLDAGTVVNHATATGTPASGTLAPATAQATIRFVPPGAGSITIVKTTTRGDATFSFTSSVPGAAGFSLTTHSRSATRTFPGLSPATYTFTEVNLPQEWELATLSCSGDTGGAPTVVDVANRTVTVGLDGGEAITCSFVNAFDGKDDTTKKIASFLIHRLTLLDDGPDRTRIFRRIPDYLWGGGAGTGASGGVTSTGPIAFSGNSSDDGGMQMSAATSLMQLSQAYALANGETLPMPTVDVWIETHYSKFDDNADDQNANGQFSVTYLGADYLLTPSLLIGALAQFDWTEEHVDGNGGSAEGFGVMAGPYVSARLASNLFFTGRVAYGISENSIDPFGLYTDDFSTDRWLASAQLTGNWHWGNWRMTPTAEVTYAAEDQHSYTDSKGEDIPSQVVSVGRVSLGPEIAYRYLAEGGTIIEPQASLTGIWDFDSADKADLSGIVTTEGLRAMAKAGFLAEMTGGATFRVVGTYDGIGSDGYDSFGGQAWLSIPLR
jgi:outer membrane autotransporter protein